jgi:polar amino acid transport system ATP-binding protein
LTKALGLSEKVAEERAMAALERCGVASRRAALPHQLSGGLKQRVALAKVLALKPKILLLDEITSGLDPEWTEHVRILVRDFVSSQGCVLNVSHQLGFVRRVSDWILFMDEGKVTEQGPPSAVLDTPQNPKLQVFVQNS